MHLRLLFIMQTNTMNPDQTTHKGDRSLICLHIIYNMGFQSVYEPGHVISNNVAF